MGDDMNSADDQEVLANFDLTLLANFVHQVVNPLNGVAGTLDNLADGVIKPEHRKEQRLRAARAQLEQCITLMRNLAFLAQGYGGVADNDRRRFVVPQAIIESAMFFQEDGERKKITIKLNDRETQNTVFGHHELIRQVLMNIFDNFIKYGMPGSVVEVDQWIQAKTGNALIRIRGMSKYPLEAGDVGKLFTLGFRGANARRVVASGTGLGLYICRRIVNGQGGEISAQEWGSSGIEFLIKLPTEPVGQNG
jgi:K+-sensing histidine kinase KdpD